MRSLRFFTCCLFVHMSCGLASARADCPASPTTFHSRATSAPYAFVSDRVLSDTDLPESLDLRDSSRNPTIALWSYNKHSGGNVAVIAWESTHAPDNGVYVVRYNTTNGDTLCNVVIGDEVPVRMDDPTVDGVHTHVSISMRRAHPDFFHAGDYYPRFFACWSAARNSTSGPLSPWLTQFDSPRPLNLAFEGSIPFVSADFAIPIPTGAGPNDRAPSAAMSGPEANLLVDPPVLDFFWEAGWANDQRPAGSRGLMREFESSTAGDHRLRCCGESPPTPCASDTVARPG